MKKKESQNFESDIVAVYQDIGKFLDDLDSKEDLTENDFKTMTFLSEICRRLSMAFDKII